MWVFQGQKKLSENIMLKVYGFKIQHTVSKNTWDFLKIYSKLKKITNVLLSMCYQNKMEKDFAKFFFWIYFKVFLDTLCMYWMKIYITGKEVEFQKMLEMLKSLELTKINLIWCKFIFF